MPIHYESDGPVAIVTIDRPEVESYASGAWRETRP